MQAIEFQRSIYSVLQEYVLRVELDEVWVQLRQQFQLGRRFVVDVSIDNSKRYIALRIELEYLLRVRVVLGYRVVVDYVVLMRNRARK